MKKILDAVQAHSIRDIVTMVNDYNKKSDTPILKDDIVTLTHTNDTYILLFFK